MKVGPDTLPLECLQPGGDKSQAPRPLKRAVVIDNYRQLVNPVVVSLDRAGLATSAT